MTAMLGAIAFDPTIRGILVVVVGTLVLVGSVYAIIATNSGIRAGFLIICAGLFGWMFLMGGVWWIYGIGFKGRDPSWIPLEINLDRTSPIDTDIAKKLPPEADLPDAPELFAKYPLLVAAARGAEGKDYQVQTLTDIITEVTPLVVLKPNGVATLKANIKKNAQDYIQGYPDADKILSESDDQVAATFNAQAREIRQNIEGRLHGWCLLSGTDTRRGEAAAASDLTMAAAKTFGPTTTAASYITLDVFLYGDKEPCYPITERSTVKQAWHRVADTVELKRPKMYVAVTVQKVKDVVSVPGQTPPKPALQPGASKVTVVMQRNFGNRRFIPFCFMVVNGLLFAVFASQLHVRDKRAMAAKAAFEAGA
jgi:hypothetical protein